MLRGTQSATVFLKQRNRRSSPCHEAAGRCFGEHRGSLGLHFSSPTDLGGSGSVGFEMELRLEGIGAQQHTRDANGHWEIPLHLIPPPPNSGISPAPPDQPFPAPTQEEQKEQSPKPASLAGGRANWPPAPGSRRGARAHPEPARKAHKAKARAPGPGRESTERGGAGRSRRAGGVGCHPPAYTSARRRGSEPLR